MATITKITRRRHENPPHGVATVKEWFNYVTAMRNEGEITLPSPLSELILFKKYVKIVGRSHIMTMFVHEILCSLTDFALYPAFKLEP